VLPISVCGKHLVAFRGDDGVLGVVDAFCSHMGTHLGYGGLVEGNNLVCPYHRWDFDTKGRLCKVPYAPNNGLADCGRSKNHIRHYETTERHGMVFAWIHADNDAPWDLSPLRLPDELGARFISRQIDRDFQMHAMEPSHNSSDWYHFYTVHSAVGQHWLSKWKLITVTQTIQPARCKQYGSKDDDGCSIEKPEVLITDEEIEHLSFVNGIFRVPDWIAQTFTKTQVRFSGPLLVCFWITFKCWGQVLIFMPLTPLEPFVTHVEYWTFATRWIPSIFARIMSHLVRLTVNQDREVWEHRMNPLPRNRVKGDYSWADYDKWLSQFYSQSSIGWDDPDLTW